ncbi:MAG: TetR/AcrR family transcriptional regulator [Pseudomonadota bacterium]
MEPPRDLKAACVAEAIVLIEEVGLEKLSLRDVARRLGVSHQAPYKHFENRDHILAEAVGAVFAQFAAYLNDRPDLGDPWADLRALGLRYFAYAEERPLHYRLMFSSVLPPAAAYPEMMRQAQHAFSLLRARIAALPRGAQSADAIEQDALFVWSTIHGLVSVMNADAFATLELSDAARAQRIDAALDRIGAALAAR